MRDLGVVGEDSSGYLLLLVRLRPCSFTVGSPAHSDWLSSPFREPQSTALALARSFSFSLSVWFTGPVLVLLIILPLQLLDSLILGPVEAMGTGFKLNRVGSMVPLVGRAAGRPITLRALDLAGRGRLRYWMLFRAFGPRKPCSLLASKLFFLPKLVPPPTGLTGMPDDLGVFPTVAELPGIWAPPAVITEAVPVAVDIFL